MTIQAPHYCASIIVSGDVVREAAPILRWALGKRWTGLRRYFERKGFRVFEQPDPAQKGMSSSS